MSDDAIDRGAAWLIPPEAAEALAGAPRSTSTYTHVSCACGWSTVVPLNVKPAAIRKAFRGVADHFASHREAAMATRLLGQTSWLGEDHQSRSGLADPTTSSHREEVRTEL